MQYYRLWIYSCNLVLGLTSAIFIIFAAFVVADVRLSLLEGVELYHPTFIYAYGALILQCGVVQTIGCLGAQRLSHKLLSLYWTLLLLLTLGDIGIGLYWVFHLEKVKVNLRPYLSKEFIEKYSTDETFTLRWNKIQSQDRCCGVDGPFDFEKFTSSQLHHSKHSAFTANSHVIVDVESGLLSLPESCCTLLYVPTTVKPSSSGGTGLDKAYRVPHHPPEEEHPPYNDQSPGGPVPTGSSYSSPNDESVIYPNDFAGGGGGGGLRRGRTVINFPHKNDEPHGQYRRHFPSRGSRTHLFHQRDKEVDYYINESDDQVGNEMDTDFYVDYAKDSAADHLRNLRNSYEDNVTAVVDVPDDDHNLGGDNHEIQEPAGPNQANSSSAVAKRDIKSYEPIHAHKVRHELHRKSHPSPLIDVKSVWNNNSTNTSLVLAKRNSDESNDGLFKILKTSTIPKSHKTTMVNYETRGSKEAEVVRKRQNQQLHYVHDDDHHYERKIHNSNQKNKSKLFPSITFHFDERKRKRRKRRPKSVTPFTTVATTKKVSAFSLGNNNKVSPTMEFSNSERNPTCHNQQPKGLDHHHNSYEKDLLDQRKAEEKEDEGRREEKRISRDERTSSKEKNSIIYRKMRKTTTDSPNMLKFASAETTGTTNDKEGGSSETRVSLLAKLVGKKSERIMTSFAEEEEKKKKLEHHSSSDRESTSFPATQLPFGNNGVGSRGTGEMQVMSRRKSLGKRDAKEDGDVLIQPPNLNSVDGSLQTSSFNAPSLSLMSSKNPVLEVSKRNGRIEENNMEKNYFFPVSSSLSSTTYLEANSPSIISPGSSIVQFGDESSWTEMNKLNASNKDNNNNNETSSTSSSVGQKRLYVYGVGCGVKLIEWVDRVSGILFILGFCIIGFVKTCFLVILRTEIREMIEKINMIEPEEAMSPTRTQKSGSLALLDQTRFPHVSHPLLQNPHRASTVSAQGVLLPTIRSPDGPTSTSFVTGGGVGGLSLYNRPNRHYLRRASNIVGGDRSRSHSNETVNMSLLLTAQGESGHGREKGRSNPNLSSAGGSSGTIANLEEKDPVSGPSITVPSTSTSCSHFCPSTAHTAAARYLRRSSTCSSSTNPTSFPYQFGIDGEPRPGPSSRFYQYFEPIYQPTHLYQQHHHHHYMRNNRSHARNMSCGAILPLTSYRTNSAAAAASAALAFNRGARMNTATLSSATTTTTSNMPASTGCSFSSNSKDETEMIISVSLEHIASSDQDEEREEKTDERTTAPEIEEEEREQQKKDWAAATQCLASTSDRCNTLSSASKTIDEEDESLGTKLRTFNIEEEESENGGGESVEGNSSSAQVERELQRRNGNNNVDLTNALPMSYIGTAV